MAFFLPFLCFISFGNALIGAAVCAVVVPAACAAATGSAVGERPGAVLSGQAALALPVAL